MYKEVEGYEVKELLGVGGFSKVYLGRDLKSGKHVALKVLDKEKMTKTVQSQEQMKQVERELAALSHVEHENIVKLILVKWNAQMFRDGELLQECILIVLELVTNGEVFDFLSFTGSFGEDIARSYFHQLVSGISHCHSHGVTHRDLKPENLLLDQHFQLKIADFGFAHVRGPGASEVMFTECGTRGYMAPEIFAHLPYTDKADWFSAGVVLFIMVAGFPPFQYATKHDWWFHKLIMGDYSLFWEAHSRTITFSVEFMDFIQQLLNPDHLQRIGYEEIVGHEWFRGSVMSCTQLEKVFSVRKEVVASGKEVQLLPKDVPVSVYRSISNVPLRPLSFLEEFTFSPSSSPSISTLFPSTHTIPPPPLEGVLNSFTTFKSSANPEFTFHCLLGIVSLFKCKYTENRPDWRISLRFVHPQLGGVVRIDIALYSSHENEDDGVVVVFHRIQGNGLIFHQVYKAIRQAFNNQLTQTLAK